MQPTSLHAIVILLLILLATGCASVIQPVKRRTALALKNQECRLDADRPYDVVEVNPGEHDVRLFWRDNTGTNFETVERLREHVRAQGDSLVAATNAGIYEPGYVPTGLFMVDGETQHPLNLKDGYGNFFMKPNGVFLVTKHGARVVESTRLDEVAEPIRYATQSGPLLVEDGRIHPAFREGSTNCRLRSGVGVRDDGSVVLAITNGATNFHSFATFFSDSLGTLDALYLDGDISKLYAPHLGRHEDDRFAGILAVVADR